MVVVRSGDGANVPDWSAESPTPPVASEITAIPATAAVTEAGAPSVRDPLPSEPAHSEPFPLARDLEPPASAALATDRVSKGGSNDPELDSPELQSGSLPLTRKEEPASASAATVTPIPSAPPTPASSVNTPAPSPSVAPSPVRAPAHAPAPTSSRAGWLWRLAAPAALAAVVLAYFGTRSAPAPAGPELKPGVEAARAEAAPVENPPAEKPAAEKPAAEKPAAEKPAAENPPAEKPAEPPPAPATTTEAPRAESVARKQSPSGVTTKLVPPGTTRVRLEVHPADSKVGRRGVTQKPPYEFDVPKGKKLVLEVLRKGYTTRKVTLDGSSTRVVVGLARARSGRGSR
jgi:hypothetical protein